MKKILIYTLALFILGIGVSTFGTSFYDDTTIYSGDFSLEAFPAVDNVSADETSLTNGTMTNNTTYAYSYRVAGLRNSSYTQYDSGSEDTVSFTGSSTTNGVEITWDRYYGAYNIILMRSDDGGTTWDEWVELDADATSYTDTGTVSWNTTDFYTAYTDELEAGSIGDYYTQAQTDAAIDTDISTHTAIADAHHAPVTLGAGSDPILTLNGQELTLGDVTTQAELEAWGLDDVAGVTASAGVDITAGFNESLTIGDSDANGRGDIAFDDVNALEFNLLLEIGGTSLYWHGDTIWTEGNDGTGSGLDADTLDGVEGEGYVATNHTGNVSITGDLTADTVGADSIEYYDSYNSTNWTAVVTWDASNKVFQVIETGVVQ